MREFDNPYLVRKFDKKDSTNLAKRFNIRWNNINHLVRGYKTKGYYAATVGKPTLLNADVTKGIIEKLKGNS